MEHEHRYEVTKKSVFGLKHVHVVGVCNEIVNRQRCKAPVIVVVDCDQIKNEGTEKRPRYFLKKDYREAKINSEEPKKSMGSRIS